MVSSLLRAVAVLILSFQHANSEVPQPQGLLSECRRELEGRQGRTEAAEAGGRLAVPPALFPLGCPEVALGVAVLDGWPWVWWVWMGSAGHGGPGLGGSGCGDPGWVALSMVALGMMALDVVALGMMALGGWPCEQQ